MPKRVHCEETSSNDGGEDSPLEKIMKATSICDKKLAHDKAEVKKTRAYKFCILNESVHEEILSFLSNQTLTKMQMITGDRYKGCEPAVAEICCKCENDNVTISCLLCRQCIQSWPTDQQCVTKVDADNVYIVEGKDLVYMPHQVRNGEYLYERVNLENFMIKKCGSKRERLKHLVKVRTRREKAKAESRRILYLSNFLEDRAVLERCVDRDDYKWLDIKDKEHWYPRFQALQTARKETGLRFSQDS